MDPIRPQATLLHYRILEKIGEGGMGEVWKATDTSLDREVAIKVLPATLAMDPERLARFEREAKLLAQLNHPNIAAIYGLHEVPSTGAGEGAEAPVRFLAMEFIPGQDLAVRLEQGPIPVAEAIPLAAQIAEAIEVAHEQGVIHRDLKPANVLVTGQDQIKVLDFGLAKALVPQPLSGSGTLGPATSPTITSAGTVAGMILGTAAYMSPEQAKGKDVDRRADIWAFGCVLFEMLTARRAFDGETVSEALASVLKDEVDLEALPADTPRHVHRLLRRCLDRDPGTRLRDMGEARIALREQGVEVDEIRGPDAGASVVVHPPSRLPWIVASLAGLVAALAVVMWLSSPGPPALTVDRFRIEIPNSASTRLGVGRMLDISPDGREIVAPGGTLNDTALYRRSLDSFEPVEIPGTIGMRLPTYSPDGQWIAGASSNTLYKVNLNGGAPISIGAAPAFPFGLTWSDDGYLYFDSAAAVWRMPADGSAEAEPVLEDEGGATNRGYLLPYALPDRRGLLVTLREDGNDARRLQALDFSTGELKDLGLQGTDARYASSGHLYYGRGDQVMVVRFDLSTLETRGTPIPVLERVWIESQTIHMAVSPNGTAAYLPRVENVGGSLLLVDRKGMSQPLVNAKVPFVHCDDPRLSPDGRRLALTESGVGNLWVVDLVNGTSTLVSESGFYPVWNPDGTTLTFATSRNRSFDLYRVPVDLSRPDALILDLENNLRSADMAPDGTLVFREEIPGKGMDLMIWPGAEDGEADPSKVQPLLTGPDLELAPDVSPDGRWFAYVSDLSGSDEIYVTSFPVPSGRVQISAGGGTSPAWSPDGKELFYMNGDTLFAAKVEIEPTFRVVKREPLFSGRYQQYRWFRQYEVHPDGEHFVMVENPPRSDVEIITNWTSELE